MMKHLINILVLMVGMSYGSSTQACKFTNLLQGGTHVIHRNTNSEKEHPFYSTCSYGTIVEYNRATKMYRVAWTNCAHGAYAALDGWHKRQDLQITYKHKE